MTNSEIRQPKRTRRWVLVADRLADRIITVGGVLVIGAVLGMMVFLVWEVLPLFKGGSVDYHAGYRFDGKSDSLVALTMDEYKTVAVSVSLDGKMVARHARTGTPLGSLAFDFNGKEPTSFSRSIDGGHVAFGFSDGTVRFGKIKFDVEVTAEDQVPSGLRQLDETDRTDGRSVFSLVPGKQVRQISVNPDLGDEIVVSENGSPILVMDYRYNDFGEKPRTNLAAVDANGAPSLNVAESKLNLLTGKATASVTKTSLPSLPADAKAAYILANDLGDQVFVAEKSGKVFRYNVPSGEPPVLAETVNLLPPGVELTVFGFLLGDRSIVVGGSDGSVGIYFMLKSDKADSIDGMTPVLARKFEPHQAAVAGFSTSQRGKTFATEDTKGNIWIRHGTSEKTLIRVSSSEGGSAVAPTFVVAPRFDGLLAVDGQGKADYWEISIPHPETSLHTLFGKVWYEGYPEPSYTWQSTGATDAFEPKLSLVPLIFGTLKATFYSLLFAIPIALLAAIYTSEFLPTRVRGKVKPVMEIMASIPSVVLGFVAALVLAPIVETWVAAVLLVFLVAPLAVVAAAYLWQTLPPTMAMRQEGLPKLLLMLGVVCVSVYGAYRIGPGFENLFFAGNFKAWLNDVTGSSVPFTFILLLPVSAVLVSYTASRYLGFGFNMRLRQMEMPYSALLDMARWLGVVAVTLASSYLAASALNLIGLDPRGTFVGTYVQRNTLIVGFAMGFAVIPIIYTLAEDALNSVPEHLRSASLGCGATTWQTAVWIILPTAISGVFSAVMIGMGRAVGETMIVVMAAGNTPLIDMNVFNGLRALSANIAVELPEAPKDGSLYRVLFLTGLVLFSMTFVINTVAELVRIHFRKRTMQL